MNKKDFFEYNTIMNILEFGREQQLELYKKKYMSLKQPIMKWAEIKKMIEEGVEFDA